jgi:hypothetical protein
MRVVRTRGNKARLLPLALALLAACGGSGDEQATRPTLSPEAAAENECFTRSADWVDLLTADPAAHSTLAYSLGTTHPMYVVISRAATIRQDRSYRDGAQAGNEAAVAYLRERCQALYGPDTTTATVPPLPRWSL